MATRRIDIRNWLADKMGDYFSGSVDFPAIGTMSSTTISDSKLTQLDTDYWKGADITFEHATGSIENRTVTDYVPSITGLTGGIIRLDTALSTVPSTNTYYYLYRRFPVDSYNRAINGAIRDLQGRVEVRKRDTSLVATTTVFEYVVPTISLIDRVLDIGYLDANYHDEPKRLDNRVWLEEWKDGLLSIRFKSDGNIAPSMSICIWGAGKPQELSSDASVLETEIPPEYVQSYAAGELMQSKWSGVDPQDSARLATFYKQEAESKIRRVRRYVPRGRLIRQWE